MKYEKGDVVTCVNNDNYKDISNNENYLVDGVTNHYVYIALKDDGRSGGYFPSRFKLNKVLSWVMK